VLEQHPGVAEAVALVREDMPGQKRLVAYLVGADGDVPAVSELRAHVHERVPDYLVPEAVVVLDRVSPV
jgi:pristinamycin I synthase-2